MTLTAMLMAGGESSRMKTDKATLVFESEMLWQRQLRLLKSLKPQEICISARVRPAWCPVDVETILDTAPSCGPLSGLAAGLLQLRTSHLLVLAIDMPMMAPQHLSKLVGLAAAGSGIVPRKSHLYEPLCAVYPFESAIHAAKALVGSDKTASLQSLIRDLVDIKLLRPHELSDFEVPLYLNINTPDDWAGTRV